MKRTNNYMWLIQQVLINSLIRFVSFYDIRIRRTDLIPPQRLGGVAMLAMLHQPELGVTLTLQPPLSGTAKRAARLPSAKKLGANGSLACSKRIDVIWAPVPPADRMHWIFVEQRRVLSATRRVTYPPLTLLQLHQFICVTPLSGLDLSSFMLI